ncbi:MAG: (2Fe-2S) ferredoxin domain-containing protein [Kofleriaceae bacterium]
MLAAVEAGLVRRGGASARVTATACLGPCFDGPNAVIYPDGVWYGGLTSADADGLLDHLCDGVVTPRALDDDDA